MEKTRILIADDEKRTRGLIREYTAPEGFETDEAGSGTQALELFCKHNYNLVVLDVMMPRIDGWTVCREIRKSSQVPVIMLTARERNTTSYSDLNLALMITL